MTAATAAPSQEALSQEAIEASLEARFASLMTEIDAALDARRKSPRPARPQPTTAPPNTPATAYSAQPWAPARPPVAPASSPAASEPRGAVPFVPMPDAGDMSRAELEAFFARANPADPRYDPAWAQAQAQHGLEQIEARATAAPHPRERGRFTAGNPGGPGRPRKPRHVQQDIVTVIANRISDEAWGQMTETAVLQAIEGDNSARRWLYQMLFKNGALNDAAAVAASGLSDDEHRLHLARERYGQAMAEAEAARQALEAELARHDEPAPPTKPEPEAQGGPEREGPEAQGSEPLGTEPQSRRDSEGLARGSAEGSRAPHAGPAADRAPAPEPPRGPAENGKKRSKTVEIGRRPAALC